MLVVFQNRIIYMPSVPPFSRSEKIEDHAAGCRPVVWKEARIRAADGTKLTLAVGEIPEMVQDPVSATGQLVGAKRKRVVIVYFQGYVVVSFLFPCHAEKRCLKLADTIRFSLVFGQMQSLNEPSTPSLPSILAVLSVYMRFQSFHGPLTLGHLRNGASIPPRLPSLSSTLRTLRDRRSPAIYTVVALSYRGFWSSSGRASEKGIKMDAVAALSWVAETFSSNFNDGEEVKCVLWGQSLGAGVAADAAAAMAKMAISKGNKDIRIDGLLLETPFVSVKDMLLELYPQKWLPYRYLGPFLRNHWDTREALRRLANARESKIGSEGGRAVDLPKILILQAGKDELVPVSQALELEACAQEIGLKVSRLEVQGALHNEVTMKAFGKAAIASFLSSIGDSGEEQRNS